VCSCARAPRFFRSFKDRRDQLNEVVAELDVFKSGFTYCEAPD
jgi:hypothetical protein